MLNAPNSTSPLFENWTRYFPFKPKYCDFALCRSKTEPISCDSHKMVYSPASNISSARCIQNKSTKRAHKYYPPLIATARISQPTQKEQDIKVEITALSLPLSEKYYQIQITILSAHTRIYVSSVLFHFCLVLLFYANIFQTVNFIIYVYNLFVLFCSVCSRTNLK